MTTTNIHVYIAVGVSCGVLLAAGGGIVVVVVVVFAVTRKTTTCDKRYACLFLNGCFYQQSYVQMGKLYSVSFPRVYARANLHKQ